MILPSPWSIMQVAELLGLRHRQERHSQQILFGKNILTRKRCQVLWPGLKLCWYILVITLLSLTISDNKLYAKEVESLNCLYTIRGNPEMETIRRLVPVEKLLLVRGAQSCRKHIKFHSKSTDQKCCNPLPSFSCINSLLQGKPHLFLSRMSEKNFVV